MTDRPAVLAVRNAQKAFGLRPALNGVSLELRHSELVSLLGPNGAGKTTLIRAICGRIKLDSGEILLDDVAVKSGSIRPSFGFVPQEIALYGDLTARENLQIFGRLHGVRGALLAECISQTLEWIGLTDRAAALVGTLSGGMKRRLNVACAVLHRPQLLLLDEPTVGVDPQSRERIFDMIAELRRAGTSILLTTHQLEDAESRSDRIVIIDHGNVIASGTVDELIASTTGPAYRAVMRIVGGPRAAVDGFESTTNPQVWEACIADPVAEIPRLLARLQKAGCIVEDLHIQRPSLQSVFLHLTGRGLRE